MKRIISLLTLLVLLIPLTSSVYATDFTSYGNWHDNLQQYSNWKDGLTQAQLAQALWDGVAYDPDTGDIDIYGPLATPETPTLVDFIAKWQAVEYENNGYKLHLFHDGVKVKQTTVAHGDALQVDFEAYMKELGSYTVRVTALATGELKNSRESRPSDPQIVGWWKTS